MKYCGILNNEPVNDRPLYNFAYEFILSTSQRRFYLYAATSREREMWIDVINYMIEFVKGDYKIPKIEFS